MKIFFRTPRPSGAIVISGAGSGIGAALALRYVQAGQVFLLLGRRPEALALTAQTLRNRGAQVECAAVDVRDAAALRRVATAFGEAYGPVSLLIANAGVSFGTRCSAAEDDAAFTEIIATNLLGLHYTISAFLPYIPRYGQVVGVGSVAGLRGLPGAAAYAASKAAVAVYLESLGLELRQRGIGVTCIAPGFIATPMTTDNPFPMPWLLPVDKAAAKIRKAIDKRRGFYILPWQMWVVSILLRAVPSDLYRRLWPAGLASKPPRAR
ncbi:MAG: SDR family oxidoreductase [Candidatus Igneacidithiobacillus chanchocoensis]